MANDNNAIFKLILLLSLIIFIPFGWFVWYTQPIGEKLFCDNNRECVVETTRFFSIRSYKSFYINPQSIMDGKYKYQTSNPRGQDALIPHGHLYFVKIDGESLFEYPVCSVGEKDYYNKQICQSYIDSVISSFNEYNINPSREFILVSLASNLNNFWQGIIIDFILLGGLIFIILLDNFQQKRKEELKSQKRVYKHKRKKTRS